MSHDMEVSTDNDLQYKFYPVSCGSVTFKVKATNDAHIALRGDNESNPTIEIFIGGWSNSKSVIRRNKITPDKIEVGTPGILNGNEFRGFWIRWDYGSIGVGYEGKSNPFMSWDDPEPFHITHVGLSSGWGASALWQVEDNKEFQTPNNASVYKYLPVVSGYLQFEFRGAHDGHVCFSAEPAVSDKMYELILGGYKNTKSILRKNRKTTDQVVVNTPNIMNERKYAEFLIDWKDNRFAVRHLNGSEDGKSKIVQLFDWSDPADFHIKYFGIRTGYGSSGDWRIKHFLKSGSKPVSTNGTHSGLNAPKTLVWVEASNGFVPEGAVVGGKDQSGETIYVARASHKGGFIPGKLIASHGCVYYPWGGKEVSKKTYEVLVGGSNRWLPASGSNLPAGAYPGGESEDGETLFIGRAHHEGTLTNGKVQQSHGLCYISYSGKEVGVKSFEIFME